jgi:beta-glucanase (GH16 family)
MMPEDSIYGQWPRSGQIDIAELRGNNRHYPRGRDLVTSTLHYGPDPQHDGYLQTYDTFFFNKKRTDFSDDFHTYGFEWYKNHMYMYVDYKPIFQINFKKSKDTFWSRGKFQGMASLNGTMADNPWRNAESVTAPFDQKFHLNLKVAVGAQHGYF